MRWFLTKKRSYRSALELYLENLRKPGGKNVLIFPIKLLVLNLSKNKIP